MEIAPEKLLSVVVPCYNPQHEIYSDLLKNFNAVLQLYPNSELILVNDGSVRNFDPETSRRFFSVRPEIKVVSYAENRGKGYALRKGIEAAGGEWIIYTDIDFPYTWGSFLKVLGLVRSGSCDVAVAVRGEEYYRNLPPSRVRISKFLRLLIRKFLNIPTDDTQCGLKGFNTAGKHIFLQTTIDRYLFDLEFIFLSARKKLSIRTVEVQLKPDIHLSAMRWSILLQEFGNFLKIFAQSFF